MLGSWWSLVQMVAKLMIFWGRKEALTKRGEILRTFSHPFGSGTELIS